MLYVRQMPETFEISVAFEQDAKKIMLQYCNKERCFQQFSVQHSVLKYFFQIKNIYRDNLYGKNVSTSLFWYAR
jgi:hypothetical protein